MMDELDHFTRVDFSRFKAFKRFTLNLRSFNILVGPNNAGKSTIIAAFRILAAALRRTRRSPESVDGPEGTAPGYIVDMSTISVAEENLFYNYDDSSPATVSFTLSNRNELLLYFPKPGACLLIPKGDQLVSSPKTFRAQFNCPIGFVPILGPVDHKEQLYGKEAAYNALYNYMAARNFRNIWHHYPDGFDEFRETLMSTWPGMDIERPEADLELGSDKQWLYMFCPEERIPREIFWSGFGFQVWCQMLTHVIQGKTNSLFLIDEPDIYLHSDLQRQLLTILRKLGPDIIVATHSTEMITDADPEDIIVVDKRRARARRIKTPTELADIFILLGSHLNPILTQLAKTRRVVFVEGQDFRILSRFAHKIKLTHAGSGADFAVVPMKGFNPQRARHLKEGMEQTLGGSVSAAAILDRDFRSEDERDAIVLECREFCDFAKIHSRKEIENFLLVPTALDRATARKVADRVKRSGKSSEYTSCAKEICEAFAQEMREHVLAQQLFDRNRFEKSKKSGMHEATIHKRTLREFEETWQAFETRMAVVPGKDGITYFNRIIQARYHVSVTATAIIDAMHVDEVPTEMKELLSALNEFASTPHSE